MLEVLDVSGLVTFQDAGRRGWQGFGVPVSGPMDWFAHHAANALAGNPLDAAVIEIGLGEAIFRARRDCVVAVTGAGYEVATYVWTFPLWTSFFVRAGLHVHVKKINGGNWAYLAAAGGFDIEAILGSRSTYLRGGLGASIHAGDLLKVGKPAGEFDELAARIFPVERYIAYGQSPILEVIPGPQKERFTNEGIQTFLNSEYTLSTSFDRMGYRLEGKPITHISNADLISEGMTMGSVQVPASGQLIVMMADGPTTGGYPKIANVTHASLPLLAQCESGVSRMRFRETTVEAAQAKYRELFTGLQIQTSEFYKNSEVW
jgi:antagonist of KipI